jgi:protein gp37
MDLFKTTDNSPEILKENHTKTSYEKPEPRCGIEWTETTWNPIRGCRHVSPGCKNCYAARMANRLSGNAKPYEGLVRSGDNGPRWTGAVRLVEEKLNDPYRWRKPRAVFVNSMSDLFYEEIPVEYIQRLFGVMRDTPQHTYQILTKRSERLLDLDPEIEWPDNVWMGVSVENNDYLYRQEHLKQTNARIKWASVEPLIGPLDNFCPTGLDWIVVGGESGPSARPMEGKWVTDIRDRCLKSRVPFFFKQWGGVRKKHTGRMLDGRTWDEMPIVSA